MQLKIQYLPVDGLVKYDKNTRKHDEYDINQIKTSIEKYGFNDPIGIWKDNIIIEGHGRLEAAKALGMKEVPVIHLDHLTDEERREYAIMHNKTAELSNWDFVNLEMELEDLDLSDFDISFDTESVDLEGRGDVSAEPIPQAVEPSNFNYSEQYGVIVMCSDEQDQEAVYEKLTGMGYECKVVSV